MEFMLNLYKDNVGGCMKFDTLVMVNLMSVLGSNFDYFT